MLLLTRKTFERIRIGEDIVITVCRITAPILGCKPTPELLQMVEEARQKMVAEKTTAPAAPPAEAKRAFLCPACGCDCLPALAGASMFCPHCEKWLSPAPPAEAKGDDVDAAALLDRQLSGPHEMGTDELMRIADCVKYEHLHGNRSPHTTRIGNLLRHVRFQEQQLQTALSALSKIAAYDEKGSGCCQFGCDTPTIARESLAKCVGQAAQTQGVR